MGWWWIVRWAVVLMEGDGGTGSLRQGDRTFGGGAPPRHPGRLGAARQVVLSVPFSSLQPSDRATWECAQDGAPTDGGLTDGALKEPAPPDDAPTDAAPTDWQLYGDTTARRKATQPAIVLAGLRPGPNASLQRAGLLSEEHVPGVTSHHAEGGP